ncbi:hypothetical protein GF322_03930 [Candidatus Dependentiae bacterium]|nr:hypothetical protein [Candidatus Dependentiae bacterium]
MKMYNKKIAKSSELQSSCIAWFKLAELISRKEKEKALSLYRLLSHSFDKAYALQVEGDILWALEDKQATEKYKQAAYLYKKEERLVAATAIYEHLLTLQPKNYNFLTKLVALYILLQWPEKFEKIYEKILKHFDEGLISQNDIIIISKKITNFANNQINLQNDEEDNIYFHKNDDPTNFIWILKSLSSILKKHKADWLLEILKKYCLEHNLNLDT